MAYAQASSIDTSTAGSDSSVKSLLNACRKAGSELIDQVVKNEAEESLVELEQLLGEEDGAGLADGRAAVQLLQMLVETLTSGESQNQTLGFEQNEQKLFLDVTTSVLRGADGVVFVADDDVGVRWWPCWRSR